MKKVILVAIVCLVAINSANAVELVSDVVQFAQNYADRDCVIQTDKIGVITARTGHGSEFFGYNMCRYDDFLVHCPGGVLYYLYSHGGAPVVDDKTLEFVRCQVIKKEGQIIKEVK